jgi:hypothetical protein
MTKHEKPGIPEADVEPNAWRGAFPARGSKLRKAEAFARAREAMPRCQQGEKLKEHRMPQAQVHNVGVQRLPKAVRWNDWLGGRAFQRSAVR